ncbi:hypothetical protein PHYPO_G00001080 [Pangasianodon hypophthalmus]|uniref:Microtubule-actin cross-linking factor 1 n=1 Tax=Pangasianodon hypophthalmus TaxID=310915 RepID=A0A5N5Q4Z4_PANHP|nr:hypothetical protein PHYPO_G00001080 [Pangasianodon hypophthalmus]
MWLWTQPLIADSTGDLSRITGTCVSDRRERERERERERAAILHNTAVMASGNRERHRVLSLKEESTSDRTPGDTLPWNLSKYQKVRRSKSASAEVLDPAERAVIRIAGGLRLNVLLTLLSLYIRGCMARLS